VRQILIDEVHDMMTGTARQQRIMLNVIRHLINEISIPLALFGTQAARTALIPDPQLARRFRVHGIGSWSAGDEFNDLVGSVLRTFPLRRPSLLTARSLKRLLKQALGNTGEIFKILRELAIRAVRSGEERITAEDVMEHTGLLNMTAHDLKAR
jgi:hypothetical protein